MKKLTIHLSILIAAITVLLPQKVSAAGSCTVARYRFWEDKGCPPGTGAAGSPSSSTINAGSNDSSCPTCADKGMPRWWVSEPYTSVHVSDAPLSYKTSSGEEMVFRWLYKQNFMLPLPDELPSLYYFGGYPSSRQDAYTKDLRAFGMTNAAWANNWTMDIMFWDWSWENLPYNPPNEPFQRETTPIFQSGYEALVFRPDNGLNYFFSTNTQSGLIDSQTQVQLQTLSGIGYPVVGTPVADTNQIYWGNAATNGYRLLYPNGSQDVFNLCFYSLGAPPQPTSLAPNTTAHALLTQRIDPQGRITRLGYEKVTNSSAPYYAYRLRFVVDTDGRTNTFLYNTNFPQHVFQVSEVHDPYGRKVSFTYAPNDGTTGFTNGLLTSITDAGGLQSWFTYAGTNGWLKSITTPYGTTSFKYYQTGDDPTIPSSFSFRAVHVTEPEGAHQLFYYRHQNQGIISPTETAPTDGSSQSFDDGTTGTVHYSLDYRNSFHWNRLQYASLSASATSALQSSFTDLSQAVTYLTAADYNKASLKHWLLSSDHISITEFISSERDPSPDPSGLKVGTRTWYNYADKPSPEIEGQPQITSIARLLPDGTSQYNRYIYYSGTTPRPGLVRTNISSYSLPDNSIGELRTWFTYATNNIDLLSVGNSQGQFATMAYNTNHQVTFVTNALQEVTGFIYGSTSHNLSTVSLPGGRSFTLNYNAPTPITNANAALLKSITIQPDGRHIDIVDYAHALPGTIHHYGTNLADLWITNSWDGLNRLTATIYPDQTSNTYTYTFLDLTAEKDRLNRWTYFSYDGLQHLKTITDPLTNITSLGWCGCGSLRTITDALTNTTTFNYDNQGNVTNILYPDNSSLTYQYDAVGRMTNAFDGSNRSWKLTYDNQGQTTAISNAYGIIFQAVYDGLGRPTLVQDANTVTITNGFDVLNRLISRTWSDNISEGFGYSSRGLILYTNRDQKITQLTRDAAGRLLGITNANQETISFGYDAAGHLTSLIDQLARTTTWRYNEYGWVTNKQDTFGNDLFRYAYDAAGQLTNRWTPVTTNTTYTYDAAGNLKGISYPGAAYPTAPITFAYDKLNQLTNMVDASGTSGFSYTPAGQLKSEDGPWASDSITFDYLQGHRNSLNLAQPSASAWTQTYLYDYAWRLQSLSSAAGVFNYGYGALNPASSLVQSIGLPNGASVTNHYDALARRDYTALANHWGHVLDGYSYIADPLGLRTNITRDFGLTTSSVDIGYDDIGQITSWSAKEADGSTRLNEKLGYAYDPAGNLRTRTNGALLQTFGVDGLNQITNITRNGTFTVSGVTPAPAASVTINGQSAQTNGDFTFARDNFTLNNGNNTFTTIAENAYGLKVTNTLTVNLPATVAFQYDANGNLVNDGLRSFAYDAENQLTNLYILNQWKSEFIYDGFGRRRISRDYTWQGGQWVKTNETRYLYDHMLVLQERDSNNIPLVTYTRGLDLSGSRQGAGGIGGLLARSDSQPSALNSQHSYYHSDASGNVTALMDARQTITARYLYDPFGKPLGKWGPMTAANRYQFSSKELHPNSGAYYYGYRLYDPNLQRWLNRDPIQESGGINTYRFVKSNPVSFLDYLGLQGEGIEFEENFYETFETPDELERERERFQSSYSRGTMDGEGTYIGGAPEPLTPAQAEAAFRNFNWTPQPITRPLDEVWEPNCPARGGRRGKPETRDQLDEVRDEYLENHPDHIHRFGGRDRNTGEDLKEYYLPGPNGARKGSSYPDLTFEAPDGSLNHVNTVDTTTSGEMTTREMNNFIRIFQQSGGRITAVPK